MMKKTIYLMAIVLTIGTGCKKDFLSPGQIDLVYNEVFWKNQKDAEKALLGTYSLYRGLMVDAQMYNRGDATTGLINRGWNGGSSDAFYMAGNFSNISGTQKSWGALESYADWNGFYKVVAQANLVISKIEAMPGELFADGKKTSILGEAYFLRALTYYNIACIWGNAPMIIESIESSTQVIDANNILINLPRSTDIQIMEQVLKDVSLAVTNLPYGTPGSAEWGIRANKGSAEALTGYANLWMGFLKKRDGQASDTNTSDAVKALENLVAGGRYSLAGYNNAQAIQAMYRGQSTEAVFELNVSFDQSETYRADHGGIEYITCKLTPLDGDVSKDRASNINFVPFSRKVFMYPEYPTDKRADLFWDAWESNYDEAFSDVSQVANDRTKVTWMKKFASFTVDPAHQWNEYNSYFAEANIPVFRFTGVKLLLAEAYVKNNQPGKAISIVNEIRSRAGLTAYSGADLLNEVLQQRISELVGEGQIFFDFVRNNYFPFPSAMTAERYAQKGYYWPVSSKILTTNKLIAQTPYWNGKTIW
ncbi:MAG: RagB/SusD family nutrient uptake outer membrane protein [Ferruginibacter sp.]